MSLSLVDADGVAVWIENDCHETDRGFRRLDAKLRSGFLQFRNRRVEMFHFQSHSATVRRWLPVGGKVRDRQRPSPNIVLNPLLSIVPENSALL